MWSFHTGDVSSPLDCEICDTAGFPSAYFPWTVVIGNLGNLMDRISISRKSSTVFLVSTEDKMLGILFVNTI
jgi:hypothetical protein